MRIEATAEGVSAEFGRRGVRRSLWGPYRASGEVQHRRSGRCVSTLAYRGDAWRNLRLAPMVLDSMGVCAVRSSILSSVPSHGPVHASYPFSLEVHRSVPLVRTRVLPSLPSVYDYDAASVAWAPVGQATKGTQCRVCGCQGDAREIGKCVWSAAPVSHRAATPVSSPADR